MADTGIAIELDHVTKVFRRRGQVMAAVRDLSMQVTRGEILGLLGPNGAGKTTAIKMICGLVTPTSGVVRLNGYDVHRRRGQALRHVGAVLEGARNVYWRLTAWQNVVYFGRLRGVTGRRLKVRAERLLRELGLWERRADRLRSFSRGMQQKVAIACTLVSDPAIVLLDEPTLGLDVDAARSVKDMTLRLAGEEGKAILLTTHRPDVAQELCSRTALLRQGSLVNTRESTEASPLAPTCQGERARLTPAS